VQVCDPTDTKGGGVHVPDTYQFREPRLFGCSLASLKFWIIQMYLSGAVVADAAKQLRGGLETREVNPS
jgi:hypothetical protein